MSAKIFDFAQEKRLAHMGREIKFLTICGQIARLAAACGKITGAELDAQQLDNIRALARLEQQLNAEALLMVEAAQERESA